MNNEFKLQNALAERKKLRDENKNLKRFIHHQSSSGLLDEDINAPNILVTNKSEQLDKIQLFSSLFRGRADTFAERWESQSGKSGYTPSCSNEWVPKICKKPAIKCSECQFRKLSPLSNQVIYNHLSGKQTIGIYPLLLNNTCWFLAIDFDKNNWQRDVLAFVNVCKVESIPFSIERSRSGNGAHVWIFFEQELPASLARKLGMYLLKKTIDTQLGQSIDSYDRLFPSQDALATGGFGNLIALPLQGKARKDNNSVFVDESFQSYEDQWSYLSSVLKVNRNQLEKVLNSIDKNRIIDNANQVSMPEKVVAVLKNGIQFRKNHLPSALLSKLTELATFNNPEFYRAKARRRSTYGLDKAIDCTTEDSLNFILPRGCIKGTKKTLESYNIQLECNDQRFEGTPIDVSFHGTLNTQQQEALQCLLSKDNGILSATTGFGKTVLGAALIGERKINTLIIVHRTQLMNQWKEQLAAFLKIDKESIGQIGDGKQTASGRIDIATIQSLNTKGHINPVVTQYGQIIVDECHHLAAYSFEQVMKNIRAKHVYGLTATPTRKDGLHPIISMQCGPILFKTDEKTQAKIRPFLHLLIPKDTQYQTKATTIQDIYNELAQDKIRNQLLFDDVLQVLEEGRTPLILTERVNHLEILRELFNGFAKNIIVLSGQIKKKDREQALRKLKEIPNDQELVVIATGKYIGEGFDCPRLDTLFLAMPISWKGVLQQYVGRLHRNYPNKEEVRVYDYRDQKVERLMKMYEKRQKGYKSMGYKIENEASIEQMKLF